MTNNYEVRISAVTLRDCERRDHNTELAFFDVEIGGVRIAGCCFIKYRNGRFVVLPPKIVGDRTRRVGVEFIDPALLKKVTDAAFVAYRALGGRYGDEGPAPRPEKPSVKPAQPSRVTDASTEPDDKALIRGMFPSAFPDKGQAQ